ncbi:MAG TPA: M6 family metalloprotease domain-containing protein, partial [Candidatus Hydrogenedentes bacterium]|nr:M6 family metalloprotease domain-containing protein [Candidatus Hydrogenedentota bacterium]
MWKRLMLVFLCGAMGVGAWASVVAPAEVSLTQPDGTSYPARPRGDEYGDWVETLDGYTVVQSASSVWVYAVEGPDGSLAASSHAVGSLSPDALGRLARHLRPPADPAVRELRVPRRLPRSDGKAIVHSQPLLTILVSFTDTSFLYSASSFQSLVYGAAGSVKAFYLENSYGNFTIVPATESEGVANDGVVAVNVGYVHPDFGNNWGPATYQLVADAIAAADPYVNYAAYDADTNGAVHEHELSILLLVAGYEKGYRGALSKTPNVWAHKYFITPVTHDGVTLSPYAMAGERHGETGYPDHQSTIGVPAHELGHLMLGLPDLYDTDGSSEGIGEWGAMSSGNWNYTGTYQGDCPAHFSAWCKVTVGMVDPVDVDTSATGVLVQPTSSQASVKRLWIDPYRYPKGEYFLVENRQLSGYDGGLPGAGLLIWHIDPAVSNNTNEAHKLVDLEEADGLNDLDSLTNRGDTGDPYPGSTANTTFDDSSTPDSTDYGGNSTGIVVTNVSTASLPAITADFTPRTGGVGDWIGYDENGVTHGLGYGQPTAWTALRVTNTTTMNTLDGFQVYVNDVSASIDFALYDSIPGGNLGTLLHSESGFAAVAGWNRFLLAAPQSFPQAGDRVIVLKIANNSWGWPAAYDGTGTPSGRCYISNTGTGTFFDMSGFGDLNQHALLSLGGSEGEGEGEGE